MSSERERLRIAAGEVGNWMGNKGSRSETDRVQPAVETGRNTGDE